MNPFKKLAGQTAIYGLPTIVGRLLNYFLVPLYTYTFSTAEFGVVTEMYAYVSFLVIILTYGMETALFSFSRNDTEKDKVYSTSLISLIVSSSLFIGSVTFFSTSIAAWIKYPSHPEYIIWFAMIIGLDALSSIPFAKLREQNKAKQFAIIKSINIATNILLNVFFIAFCKDVYNSHQGIFYGFVEKIYNPEIGIGYIFISNLIASIVTILLLLPGTLRINYTFDIHLWKRMLLYALPLLIAGLAGMVNETMDRVLLKYLLPDKSTAMAQLGIYGACYKVSILMTIFIQTFRYAAEPFFFSHAKEKDSKQLYADVMKYFVIACSFIFLGTMMYIDIVKYFVGKDFREGLPVVPILLLANLCLGVFFNLSIWYKLTGQTLFGAYLAIFGATVTLVLNFWWIPVMGYMGSAWATLVCYASMMVVSFFIGQKHYPVNYDLKRILGYLFVSLALYFASTFLKTSNNHINIALNSVFLLGFIILVYILENLNSISLKK